MKEVYIYMLLIFPFEISCVFIYLEKEVFYNIPTLPVVMHDKKLKEQTFY